ncbi:MAG: DUF4139 domain-containing protein [Cytophagaceae bacterium]
MRYYFLLLCLFLLQHSGHAVNPLVVEETNLKEVKVFFQGAEFIRNFSLTIPKGRSEIHIRNLSSDLDINSLIVASSNVRIISVHHETEGERKQKEDLVLKKLKSSKEEVAQKLAQIELQILALEEEKKILVQNSLRIGSQQGLSLNDLDQSLVYMRKKQEEINSLILKKKLERASIADDLHLAQEEYMKRLGVLEETGTMVSIVAEAENQLKADFYLSYYVESCAWAPTYNIYSSGSGVPVELDYKANVLNNSGEDWKKVKLSLLAGNPSRQLTAPILETWVLSYTKSKFSGKVYSRNDLGNEGNLSKKQIKSGKTAKDVAGFTEIELEEGLMIFELVGEHSIPSQNREFIVDVNRFTLEANFRYQTIPKLDPHAYLIATVKDWEELKLIEGDANVFLHNTYMGRTYLDPMGAGDSLEFSLGPDPAIQITRIKKKDLSTRRFIGLQLQEVFAYEIDVRNLKKI